jgi:tRNA(Ile2) C34 agmatinyltransferase TiaS
MRTATPPEVGWRVCLKSNPKATGIVVEISRSTRVIDEQNGERVRYHDVRIDWDDKKSQDYWIACNPWVPCCNLDIITHRTAKEQIAALKEMIKRRKKAYGSSFKGNEAFLSDEVLQEVISILKE